jgi:hypothetical protein
MDTLSPQELSTVLWSYATQRHVQPQALEKCIQKHSTLAAQATQGSCLVPNMHNALISATQKSPNCLAATAAVAAPEWLPG